MDIQQAQEYGETARKQREISDKYAEQRKIASKAKTEMEILLVSALPTIRMSKPNVGIEMALLMLMEYQPETKLIYRQWKEAEGLYKGYEKILDANSGAIMYGMALMKYEGHGEKFG